jgi:hypothetical protein
MPVCLFIIAIAKPWTWVRYYDFPSFFLSSTLAAILAIATGHAGRSIVRETEKVGFRVATIGLSLGYGFFALMALAFMGVWSLVTFTDFGY